MLETPSVLFLLLPLKTSLYQKKAIMSDDDKDKQSGGGGGAPARWMIPKLLTSALILAFLLILFIDLLLLTVGNIHHHSLYLFPLPLPVITSNTSSSSSASPHNETSTISSTWVSPETPRNFTSTLLSRWLEPGGSPCRDSRTSAVSIQGLDGIPHLLLAAGTVHEFVISALDEQGNGRCLGGDYFEMDLSGSFWKSRPPIVDHGNGSYSFRLQVHPDFAGRYTLTVVLLFQSFLGLKFSPERFKFRKELRNFAIDFFRNDNVSLPELTICQSSDFYRDFWSGRWTRHTDSGECDIDDFGRYRCLDPNFKCIRLWCDGPLGMLESNGWVYSAHCSFRIFTSDLAWNCLNNKWFFFWGDSNHVDTIRNLLNFVLGLTDVASVPRRFDRNFTNPVNESESVRITSIFNGHWNDTQNYLGLQSLRNDYFRELLWQYFSEEKTPDVMIFNSGLHDGVYWKSIRAFVDGAEFAAKFWEEILDHIKKKGLKIPRIFYRTTIATGGYARDLAFNPNKMEVFNGVVIEKLKDKGILTGGVIDEFDMTFPWHYDNRCNDGVHYGRAPAKAKWRDGQIGHQYFVDLMLVHVLLNAICSE